MFGLLISHIRKKKVHLDSLFKKVFSSYKDQTLNPYEELLYN